MQAYPVATEAPAPYAPQQQPYAAQPYQQPYGQVNTAVYFFAPDPGHKGVSPTRWSLRGRSQLFLELGQFCNFGNARHGVHEPHRRSTRPLGKEPLRARSNMLVRSSDGELVSFMNRIRIISPPSTPR